MNEGTGTFTELKTINITTSVVEEMRRKKANLEEQLKDTQRMIELLESNPDMKEMFDLLAKSGRRIY